MRSLNNQLQHLYGPDSETILEVREKRSNLKGSSLRISGMVQAGRDDPTILHFVLDVVLASIVEIRSKESGTPILFLNLNTPRMPGYEIGWVKYDMLSNDFTLKLLGPVDRADVEVEVEFN